jgi:hypothetical protein
LLRHQEDYHTQEFPVAIGTSLSHSSFLAGDLTDAGDCSHRGHRDKDRKEAKGPGSARVYEITATEEYARINNLSGAITFDSSITSKIGD